MKASRLIRIASILILLLCVWIFTDVRTIWGTVQKVPLSAFLLCVVGELLFYLIESLRILILSKQRMDYRKLLSSRFISAFAGSFMPGAISGEVVRVFILGQDRKNSKFYILLVMLANRLYGAVALACVMLIALMVRFPEFPLPAPAWIKVLVWVGCPPALVAPLLLHLRPIRRLFIFVLNKTQGKVRRFLRSLLLAGFSFSRPSVWAVATGTSVISNCIVVAEFWFLGSQLGLDVNFTSWCFWIAITTVASFLPLGIGAIGPQESAMLLGASILKIRPEAVLALSFSIHAVRFVGTLPGLFWASDLLTLGRELHRLKIRKLSTE